jgi:hypothetical protein
MQSFSAFIRTYIAAEILLVLAVAIFILDQVGRVQAMSGLPHWVLQGASAIIFLAAVISVLYHQHKRLESFKPPPAPPAADTATSVLANMLAQVMYVRDTRQSFESLATVAEDRWTAFLAAISAVTPEQKTLPASPWKTAYSVWIAAARNTQKFTLQSMGYQRDFLESENFKRNPGIMVPSEQNLETEADKYELRRAYDEHRSCAAAVQQFRAVLNAKETPRKTTINNAAKPSVADKA